MSDEIKKYLTLAEQINRKKDEVGKAVFEIAKWCAEANGDAKSPAEKEELFAKLDISESDFSKYLTVGDNKFLRNHLNSLPLHLSHLYALARLDEKAFKSGVSEGIIHAKASRRSIESWIAQREGKAKTANDNQRVYRVIVPNDFSDDDEETLKKDIGEFLALRRCRLGGAESETGVAVQRARGEYIRAASVALQKREKGRREQEQRLKPKAQRTKAWPFSADQLKLGSKATADDCQRVLELIGCGEDYPIILAEADRVFGALDKHEPTSPKKASPRKKAA